ncbi:MAG: DUF4270 domain-containing protein [Bacteroidales bacterium]|nr:DUF4270 domain-containing protein [Bacteroidales bacterium]
MTKYYHSFTFPNRYFSDNLLNTFRLTFFSAILFFAVSCEEDPTTIGKKILPASDFVTVISTDTISVSSYTMYTDSVASDNPTYSYLGQIYDPYFGTTTAGFVTQLRLSDSGVDEFFAVDSVKLCLTLINVQGNVEAGHILKLSEIAEQIYTDSTYYSNKSVLLTGYDVPDIELPELKADTINTIVLDIPVEFGSYLTRLPSMLKHSNTEPDFRSFFKGLYFRLTTMGDPAFLTLSLTPKTIYNNYFVVYYRDEVDEPKEFYFILDAVSRNAYYNTYSHDFDTAEPGKKIQHINDGFRDTLTYLQCFNGVFIKIALPGLGNIKNDPLYTGISVNKARIICPAWYDGSFYKPSTFPSQIYLRYIDDTGTKKLVHDLDIYNQTYGNYPFFDGTIDTTAGVYNLNIASYVQNYLEDTDNKLKPEVEIFLPSGSTKNAILKANSSSNPVKFEFTYTRF